MKSIYELKSEAYNLLSKDWGNAIGVTFILFCVSIAASLIPYAGDAIGIIIAGPLAFGSALSIERSENTGSVFGRGLGGQGNCQIPVLPEALQGFMAFLKGERFQGLPGDVQRFPGACENAAATDAVDQPRGKGSRLTGICSLYRLLGPVQDCGLDLVEFGLGEPVFEGPSQFLFHHRHGFLPFAFYGSDIDGAEFNGIEPFEPPRTPGGNGRALFLGENIEPAPDHGICNPEWHTGDPGSSLVWSGLVFLHEPKSEVVTLDLLVGKDRSLESESFRDLAHLGLFPGLVGIFHGGEGCHNTFLVGGRVDITHDYEGHVGRDVIIFVK